MNEHWNMESDGDGGERGWRGKHSRMRNVRLVYGYNLLVVYSIVDV